MSEPSHQRLGRGMMMVAVLAALGLLTLVFNGVIEGQRNPNQLPITASGDGFVEVTLNANRQDHYVAAALINGQEVEIMVDTGATQVAISDATARRLGLPRGRPFTVSTANGSATAHTTRVTSIRLGSIEMRDVSAAIVPNMSSPDVLLGMNFLRELELKQSRGQLVLRQYQ
ncbi:MAG: TIGR02281 family clan AA aspartic protease [Lysobacterales bacterium]